MIFPSHLSNGNEILCIKRSNSKTARKLGHLDAVYLHFKITLLKHGPILSTCLQIEF